jgi:hypothetical protein
MTNVDGDQRLEKVGLVSEEKFYERGVLVELFKGFEVHRKGLVESLFEV